MVFEHPIMHEGSELKSGRKYTIRTDIMYSAEPYIPENSSKDEGKELSDTFSEIQLAQKGDGYIFEQANDCDTE